jgi:hypothetical protein
MKNFKPLLMIFVCQILILTLLGCDDGGTEITCGSGTLLSDDGKSCEAEQLDPSDQMNPDDTDEEPDQIDRCSDACSQIWVCKSRQCPEEALDIQTCMDKCFEDVNVFRPTEFYSGCDDVNMLLCERNYEQNVCSILACIQ